MTDTCGQQIMPGSLDAGEPEHCDLPALDGLGVCRGHAELADPDAAHDALIERQMEVRRG